MPRPSSITRNISGGKLNGFGTVVPLIWTRNLGIVLAMAVFLYVLYLLATEYISAERSKGGMLLFLQHQVPKLRLPEDQEALNLQQPPPLSTEVKEQISYDTTLPVEAHAATLVWDKIIYDIKAAEGSRRLLDDVQGWIKPGTLTALMVSQLCRFGRSPYPVAEIVIRVLRGLERLHS